MSHQILANSFVNNNSYIYIIMHPISSYYYIGSTSKSLLTRFHQHLYDSTRTTNNHISTNLFHRYLRDNNSNSFVILPISISPQQSQSQRLQLEIKLIRKFQPKLNTLHSTFNHPVRNVNISSSSITTPHSQS